MPLRTLVHLPYTLAARRDAKAVTGLLQAAGLDLDSPVGHELFEMLHQRTLDCRDFFALRGGCTRRATLLVMAGRSLAEDPIEAARLTALTAGRGRALLSMISLLIEQTLMSQQGLPAQAAPAVRATTAPEVPMAAPSAPPKLRLVASVESPRSGWPVAQSLPDRLAA